ncbi:MAG: transposase [Granulosicoccus sp.]
MFPKEAFEFDAEADLYRCPAGQELRRHCRNKVREGVFIVVYRAKKVCSTCPLKASCTQHGDRQVSRYEDEAVLEKMAERLAARPEVLDQRRDTVEHPLRRFIVAFEITRLLRVGFEFALYLPLLRYWRYSDERGVKQESKHCVKHNTQCQI